MFEHCWGNPATIMFSGGQSTQVSDRSHQILGHYNQAFGESLADRSELGHPRNLREHHQTHLHPLSLYAPQAFGDTYAPPAPPMPSLAPSARQLGIAVAPKIEPVRGGVDFAARVGLNLAGRSWSDELEKWPSRRFRHLEVGSAKSPRCQAEGCNADLARAKNYHRRHKVCEFHSKAAAVAAAGIIQRFCQQCSRFHLLSEFDDGKRSCRKRLAVHNRRRRKSQKLIQGGNSNDQEVQDHTKQPPRHPPQRTPLFLSSNG